MYNVRVTYTKSKEASYISEKDLVKVIEMAMIRAGIYLEYNKDNEIIIDFANTISFGIESTCEIFDIKIKEHVEPAFMVKGLNRELPAGMVVLTVNYLSDGARAISECSYAETYEIIPNLGDVTKMTNREYEDKKKWYRFRMEEYLSEPQILVLVKHEDRSERIDIKPAIIEYMININSALKITVSKNTEYIFNPNYIMDGFKEYINDDIEYTVKRIKILMA